ncbi:MAG: ribonuclease III [Verrucomicrobia subdivision 3 bacterium]|nr:ribonuclease III [Limisphaerales bacterium]
MPLAKPNLQELQDRLGYQFKQIGLLQLALTHPSVAHEVTSPTPHNQRLEFLGDAVLGLVLTQELYETFHAVSEGPLTKARAQMVNRRSLAEQARHFHLGEFLILSRGEETSGGREKQSALADAFEAVLGAIFLDGGFEAARAFILGCFRNSFGQLARIPNIDNPKGELQEMLQSRSSEAPRYETTSVTGPDHDRVFECAVHHEGRELGRGTGKSKKAAESQAALAALQTLTSRHGEGLKG